LPATMHSQAIRFRDLCMSLRPASRVRILPSTRNAGYRFSPSILAKEGRIEIQRIAEPRNVVFIEDEKLAPMKLSGLNFDVAKAPCARKRRRH